MKTITFSMYVNAKRNDYSLEDNPRHFNGYDLYVQMSEDMSEYGYISVKPIMVSFEMPDNWNPVPDEIAILEKQRDKIRAETQVKVNQINDLIGKLQSLPYEPVQS